ncbi:uncharacterized protein LOC134211642 [Armigeres subalbatus]|uniref:uncharacterized protein LOC134211642 n=1 Tax=Armigeres subalbatus TaxID=124917 RepID=UPI002ECFCC6E
MLRYLLSIVLLLQCSTFNNCESARSRINIKHRYSPSHIKLHSPHQHLVSPINLLNPDKYEYFTINNQGNIIKRLMTSKEIQSIVAGNNIKQSVFDRLESPQGIITNIVSSIKNVLNTELLSKHQENQNADNNVNHHIADVTTFESTDKENEYVPAVLSFEISSPDEEAVNSQNSKQPATALPETSSQFYATEKITINPTQYEKVTGSTSQQFDEDTTEKVPMMILSLNTPKPEEVQFGNTKEPDYAAVSTTIPMFGEQTDYTFHFTASTEKLTENTPMLLGEYTNKISYPTIPTEQVTEITPQLLNDYTAETTYNSIHNITKPIKSTPYRPTAITTEYTTESTSYQTDDKLLMSYLLTNKLSDQLKTTTPQPTNENTMETTELSQLSTLYQTADNLLTSFIINKPDPSETLQVDPQDEDRITTFTLPSTLSGTNSFETTTAPSRDHFTQFPKTTFITTIDGEYDPSYTTQNDYHTKLVTSLNRFGQTTVQDATTELNTQEYNFKNEYSKTTVNAQGLSTIADTTNKPETSTFSEYQTTDVSIQQQPDKLTTLSDTQNSFYMILELLKDDTIDNESSIQQYGQNNIENTVSQEIIEEGEMINDMEDYSLESTTTQATTEDLTSGSEVTTEQSHYKLPELMYTDAMTEKYTLTDLFSTWNDIKTVTPELNPTTTITKRPISTTKPILTTAQMKLTPSKSGSSSTQDAANPSSNEFVSIAEMILRQANLPVRTDSAENVDVQNLINLLSVTNKNMSVYVDETATVASVLKPMRKPQPVHNSEPSSQKVDQSFLSVTNELKQDIRTELPEVAANRITNDLFQKLGESEGRRNTSFSDQLNTSDLLLITEQTEEFPEDSEQNNNNDDSGESSEMNDFFRRCNRIGMDMFRSLTTSNEFAQTKSFTFSPFSAISMISMLHLGARGKTAEQIDKLIGLDEMTSFNPHVTFRAISQSIEEENANSYFVRMLFSDKKLGELQNFFKTKVRQLYSGYAEEIVFDDKNTITKRINTLVNNSTQGAYSQFLESLKIRAAPPLCLISANSFELGCTTDGDNPDIFFHIIDANSKRKLIYLTADVYTGSFLFGYNPEMDVSVASVFSEAREISTLFLMPGQQGGTIEWNSLLHLENSILKNFPLKLRLLETKLRPQLNSVLHIPHLNQHSFVNVSRQLHQLGLGELFHGDSSNLRGIQETTVAPIHMSEFLQVNRVSLCGTSVKERSSEMYSSFADVKNNLKKYRRTQNANQGNNENVIKFDKPFLYIIRHNPSQLILYVGRFNPVE